MIKQEETHKISELEFIALMAFLMANVALAIDAILPAMPQIGQALNRTDPADLQLLITTIFLGLGIGQLFFGTISDSLGRKPVVYAGIATFLLASIITITAGSLEMMLLGRVLQGVGLSAPRSISISIIRDLYTGDYMARIMSFIAVIFVLIPMVAPIMGQLILDVFDWQSIFYFQMAFALATLTWFRIRQKETLPPEKRISLTARLFIDGLREFLRYRQSIVYTLISGFMTGSFMVFLSASQQIFQDQYGFVEEFAFIFAGISFFFGVATFFNGSLVIRYGMRKLSTTALYLFTLSGLAYTVLFFRSDNPDIWVLIPFLGMKFLCLGFIFGNVRALAMEPIGHIAGIGASLNGFVSTVMAVPIAIFIGQYVDGTALPLFMGFFTCGALSLLLLVLLKRMPGR